MQNCLPGLLSSTAEPFTPAERAAEVLRAVDGKMNKADICMRVEEALTILTGSGKQKADFFHYRLVQPGVYTDILGWTDLF